MMPWHWLDPGLRRWQRRNAISDFLRVFCQSLAHDARFMTVARHMCGGCSLPTAMLRAAGVYKKLTGKNVVFEFPVQEAA